MRRIALVSPPFTTVSLPSLALAQLKARLRPFADRVQVDVIYLNHDFARWLGIDDCGQVAGDPAVYQTGFGDWFFRQLAFPDVPDNTEAYLRRFFRTADAKRDLAIRLLARRGELSAFLDRLITEYALDRADMVGVTSMFAQTVAGIALARKIKRANPETVTVIGGPCCEGPMGRELAARVDVFDHVFSGGALVSFPALVDAWLAGEVGTRQIRGVFSRARRGRLAVAGDCTAELGEDLSIDEVIDLDYNDFLQSVRSKLGSAVEPGLLFETSRGCWWGEIQHCTFCGLNGSTMAHREVPADRAVAQFEGLFQRYPQVKFFEAVDNILPHGYLKSVLPRVEAPDDVTIYYEVKSNMDEEDVAVMQRSHVRAFQPGIESINSATLKRMRKGVTAFQNIRFLGYCLLHGVIPKWSILIGFPGEPDSIYEKYLRDFPLLHHLPPPQDAAPVRFDRFSPYQMRPEEYGLELHPFDFYSYVYPFEEAALKNIAFYFVHRDPRFYVPIARWYKVLMAAVETWQGRWTGADGKAPAHLFMKNGVVHDTRSGSPVEHAVSEAGARILQALRTPRTIAALAESEPDAEREVERLRAQGLLFEEEGALLSVVSAMEPRPPAWDKRALVHYGVPPYLLAR